MSYEQGKLREGLEACDPAVTGLYWLGRILLEIAAQLERIGDNIAANGKMD